MTLDLVLTFFWFDEIAAGRKNIEYREIKPIWYRRIWKKRDEITHVRFRRGYTSKSLKFKVDFIDIGVCPYDGWNDKYFRIHFSEIKDKK